MAKVSVSPSRARVEDDGISIRVTIPTRLRVAPLVFLTIWLCFWFFGEKMVALQLLGGHARFHGPAPFLVVWLAAWTLAGAYCLFVIAWMLRGCETLTLRSDALVVRRSLFGLGRDREYDLANVKALRVGPATTRFGGASANRSGRAGEAYGLSGGPITFDYGPSTIRCGAALEEAEATALVERLWQRNPRLRPTAA